MELKLENGKVAGTVSVQRQGEDTLFSVTARLPQGLWRIVARGTEGALALGVLEGGSGTLHRRFSGALVQRIGTVQSVTAMVSAGARMESEWQACRQSDAPHLPPLPPGALFRRTASGSILALPWRQDGPFPWPELFCLARVGTMAGRLWVFYALDPSGRPVLPQEN